MTNFHHSLKVLEDLQAFVAKLCAASGFSPVNFRLLEREVSTTSNHNEIAVFVWRNCERVAVRTGGAANGP